MMELKTKLIEETNRISARLLPRNRLGYIIPPSVNLIEAHVTPLLPSTLTPDGVCLVVLALGLSVVTLFLAAIGVLQIIVSAMSLILVARCAIVSVEHKQPRETSALLTYFVLLSGVGLLEGTPLAFFLSFIPFYSFVKSFFFLVLCVPQTGIALRIYDALARPYFGPGGVFASSPAAAPGQTKTGESEARIDVFVKTFERSAGEGPVYCIFSMDTTEGDESVCFVTSTTGGNFYQHLYLPMPTSWSREEVDDASVTMKVTVMAKQQFGSDSEVGSASCRLQKDMLPKSLDLSVSNDGVSNNVGTLCIDVSSSS